MKKSIFLLVFLMFATLWLRAQAGQDEFRKQVELTDLLIRDGQLDVAETQLKALLITKNINDHQKALLYTTAGSLYLNKGRNDLSLDYLQQALLLWERSNKSQTLEAAQTQTILGNLYRTTGKYEQADEQLSIALLTRQKLLPENDELIAGTLNDLGLVYTYSDIDKSLYYYEQAMAIYEQLHGNADAKTAIAKANIGYLYNRLDRFDDAISHSEAALSIWNKLYKEAHPAKGFVLFNLGQTYEKKKDLKTARLYYEQASTLYKKVYAGKHPEVARVYNALGNLDRAENKFDEALNLYQKALQANHPTYSSEHPDDNPSIKEYYDGNVFLYSLMFKAQALEARYYSKTLRFKDLLLAIRTLESCDTLIDRLRQQINSESDKITLGAISNEIYADGVRICSEAALDAWKKKSFLEKAFFFAEKSKAAVLLGAISDANAKTFAGIPADLLEEEKQLKSAIALCSQKLAQKPSGEEEKYLRQTFYDLNRSYEAFGKKLEAQFPAYYNLKYNASSPSIRQLQQKLSPGTLLLSYFIDEKNNRLYLFRISSSNYQIEETLLPVDFDRNITGLRNSLYFSEIKTYQRAAMELSSVLVPKKIPSGITDLVIIPTARLNTIPFETLFFAQPSEGASYKTFPYLARKFAIRYEFSGGLILQKSLKKPNLLPSILLCAPVSFMKDQMMPDLPGTEAEVQDISSIFREKQLNSHLMVGNMADEQSLKRENLKQYAYLHFATHGVVDAAKPELSRIFLKSEAESEDGNLYAGEIYNLELDADLVTLSACETGLGKISKGEGVIGLSRALVYAGARNCLVSFWKVSDQSTALLMKAYYQQLLTNPERNFSATLQKAKIDMMEHETFGTPFFWAPFILIGF